MTDARPEPRSMTLVDLVTFVAGVALGFAVMIIDAEVDWLVPPPLLGYVVPPPWMHIVFGLSRFLQVTAFGISVVALGRVASYRRMPRPAEWLVFFVAAWVLVARRELGFYSWANDLPSLFDHVQHDGRYWVVASLATLAILATLVVLRLGRRAFPDWLKTVLLAWIAVLALAGPLEIFASFGPYLISSPGIDELEVLQWQACELFCLFPRGVFFGVPAIAVMYDRLCGQRWDWDEWAGTSISMLVGFSVVLLHDGELGDWPYWLAERTLILAWLMAVALTSRLVLSRLGPRWRRWIEGPADPDQSRPESDSEASTL